MTYDNTWYAVDIHIHPITQEIALNRGSISVYVPNTDMIKLIDGLPHISMRKALELGLITEFMYQQIC